MEATHSPTQALDIPGHFQSLKPYYRVNEQAPPYSVHTETNISLSSFDVPSYKAIISSCQKHATVFPLPKL